MYIIVYHTTLLHIIKKWLWLLLILHSIRNVLSQTLTVREVPIHLSCECDCVSN